MLYTEMLIIDRDPFADGTLVLQENKTSIRLINGSNNNQNNASLGSAETVFINISPKEYEDGIQSPAGVAFDAEGNPFFDVNGTKVTRQPIPIFTQAEKDRLLGLGFNVINNTNSLSNQPSAPFVLLNPSDRPSARIISNTISKLNQGESLLNTNGLNALNWSFGQFVNHDNNYAAEPRDEKNKNRVGSLNFPIDIPTDDPNFPLNIPATPTISRQKDSGLQFDFPRSAFELGTGVPLGDSSAVPGKTPNEVTHWLDLSAVYGSEKEFADGVRAFTGGLLKVTSDGNAALNDDLLPADSNHQTKGGFFQGAGFFAGDDRVSENDNLAAQQTLWMRNHNRIARELSKFHGSWTDEQIFQRARQINIAQFEQIVMYEWLPLQIGNVISTYQGYDPNKTPEVSNEFNAAGFRFGHSQTNNQIQTIDVNGKVTSFPLLTAFGAPHINSGSDVDSIVRGDTQLIAEKVDTNVVFDLRNALFPPAGVGFDLYSANIQRGRDRGLADYNQVRASVGLERVTSFSQITSNSELASNLENLYHTVEDIDLLVGLFSEDPVAPSGAGITIQKLVGEQFARLRDSDSFWFERPTKSGGFFTSQEIAEIKQTTLADIIKLNTEISNVPNNALLITSESNPVADDVINVSGFSGEATVTLTREAGLNNSVGFYVVSDRQGTVIDPLTGKSLTPSQGIDYAKAAISRSVAEFRVNTNLASINQNVILPDGAFLAPYIVQNGSKKDFEAGKSQAFFAFEGANSDGCQHILQLGNASSREFKFAFEDLTGSGLQGSDRDFNDIVMQVNFGARNI
jgi:peroxidase